jgi:hypothetical protein
MKTINVTTQQSLTRRTAVRNLLAIGAMSVAALGGNDSALAAATRRSTRGSDRRDDTSHSRDRHLRPPRRPRINVYFDRATSSVTVMGDKFSSNARVTIRVDSGSPILDYSLPLFVSSSTSVGAANYQGRFNQSIHISPLGCNFTGRVEATDPVTGMTASANFSGAVC